jgi:pimeloyl-ACP methyl ester carboxylesterase
MEPAERVRVLRDNRVPGTARAFQRALEGVVDVLGQRALAPPNGRGRVELPPTALFWGRRDPVIPVRHAIAAAARCPGLGLTIYERCGHYPHLDAAERFAADLLAFLADDQRPAIPLARFGRAG